MNLTLFKSEDLCWILKIIYLRRGSGVGGRDAGGGEGRDGG